MSSMRRSIGRAAILFAAAACGSDSGGDSSRRTRPGGAVRRPLEPSGDGQSGTAGQELANPLRIVVLRGSAPEAGAVVTWSTTATGATLTPSTGTTGPDGISSSVWHLGAQAGVQSAQAVVAGADGSPVRFTATAGGPGGGPTWCCSGRRRWHR
jgi:hypothetical protein